MCIGMPGQIVDLTDAAEHRGSAEVNGAIREVNIGLVLGEEGGLSVGDWVLIHMGFAMARIDEDEAAETLAFMTSLDQIWEEHDNPVSADSSQAGSS
ncbi:MAG: HypC/HybG/HupF family hydrogenase formation chaperone [Actinomycetota bacterium]|nr:HypC/HybG/HupF family hydrogenase formation chaperone [Actinomycetota bacterium]